MTPEDSRAPNESLAGRIVRALRTPDGGGGWRVGAAVAVLLALAPLLTLAGAWWSERQIRGEIAALSRSAAPQLTVARDRDAARATLGGLLARPTLGVTIEALARVLPTEANLAKAGWADGRLAIEAAAPDPDRLRAALRRDSVTAGLRDVGQRRGDGGMLVALEDAR